MPVAKAGVGSAVLNAMRQVGGSLGIALMGAIVAHSVDGRRDVDAFLDGFQNALTVASLIAFAGAIVAFSLIRQEVEAEPAPVEVAA